MVTKKVGKEKNIRRTSHGKYIVKVPGTKTFAHNAVHEIPVYNHTNVRSTGEGLHQSKERDRGERGGKRVRVIRFSAIKDDQLAVANLEAKLKKKGWRGGN